MESLYQYLWKYRLLGDSLVTVGGCDVKVLYPGVHNHDAGPDFSGARVRIGDQEWCGNVEVHVRASDWFRHRHDSDPAYGNVILHVVGINDAAVHGPSGEVIPQIVATFPESFVRLYARLSENISSVACAGDLAGVPPLVVTDWTGSLAVERMQMKARRVLDTLGHLEGDWEWTCFVTLARSLGFGLNGDPLEMLARSLPLRIMARHSDDLMQTEALLFGQAGMLDTSTHIFDSYYQKLCREYFFLARKYGLRPMRRDLWKFARSRPQNFPTRRIALLARALYGGFSLLSRLTAPGCGCEESRSLLDWRLDGYWTEHLDFDMPGTRLPASLSAAASDLLLVNFVAPLLYAFGVSRGNPDQAERGLDMWRELDAENNSFIRRWKGAGIPCRDAMDSQGLLHLSKEYCDRGRCLECRFGHFLLRDAAGRCDSSSAWSGNIRSLTQ